MDILLTCALIAIACALLTRAYCQYWSEKLSATLRFLDDGVFEGEQSAIVETVSNNKLLPIFWGSIQFKAPGALRFDGKTSDTDYDRKDIITVFSYEQIEKRLRFTAGRRGYYRLCDMTVTATDLLFNYRMHRKFPVFSELYIYPRVKDADRFKLDFNRIVGEVVARRSLVADPFFFRGIRDYTPFDSIRSVNWNATARTGELKVNQYHSTQSQEVMLLLDLDGFNRYDGQQIKEDLISIAALLARRLTQTGVAIGLVSNATQLDTRERTEFSCKSGRGHYIQLLRGLSKLDTEQLTCPFDRTLDHIQSQSRSSTQYILISYFINDELTQRITQCKADGIEFQWIFLKDKSRNIHFSKLQDMIVSEVDYG